MLKNFRLGTRLGFGFGCLILIFVIACTMLLSLSNDLGEKARIVHIFNVPKAESVTKILDSMYQMRLSTQSALRHRGSNVNKDGEAIVKYRNDALAHTEEFGEILKKRSSKDEVQIKDFLQEEITAVIPMQEELIKHAVNGNELEIIADLEKLENRLEPVMARLGELIEYENGRVMLRTEEIMAGVRTITITVIVSAAMMIVLALLAAFFVTRSITQPVKRMLGTVEAMAGGDLSRVIIAESKDEIGVLQSALGRMNDNLARMIGEVRNGAKQLVSSASELSGAAASVRKSSEKQSEAATAMAAALEQMSASIGHVSTLSEDARQTSSEAGQSAHSGSDTIHTMVNDIRQISDAIGEGAAKAQQLGKESERISTIVHVIRDVADQTNLLALNAAIEAARAGEQGRGFAVVADEVRKLAERTTTSTADINATVSEIQQVTAQAVASMDLAAQEVETGIGKLRESVAGLEGITQSSSQVTQMAGQISDAARQQGVASEEMASSMQQITDLIEQNTGAAREARHAADELLNTAHKLDQLISGFELYRR
ncbi:methyl-accepting chemotaxis protein [Azonexus sp.]|jgi:methyl-accepting chemotaxis protein|uniref:methyl-accepting chemotaxis protein n=1 Tax=Azonexus sp. TaxID=1872668 RepID=UPI00282DA2E1|nr:methyl-accepting chemotaxis protein [Azonexus sp.]MDR1994763.1 methyl-accepting chemotaxis protein [Azonexus sp.]